ncbi:MAG: hypothetical protein Kow00105_03680 [Phycisphaeraceae bacterium]
MLPNSMRFNGMNDMNMNCFVDVRRMPRRPGRWMCRWSASRLLWVGWVAGLLIGVAGCESSDGPGRAAGVAPAPVYTGPAYLRGTIGSMVRLRPGTDQPLLVSGYGLVVNLNGTGSTSAPPAIREALINQMKKFGLGSANLRTQHMTPQRVLADPNTAVVRVDGLIPPGATPGLRFDVLVTAIDSQTTSLAGGTLWTSSLGVYGALQPFRFQHELAKAHGPIYENPYTDQPDSGEPREFGGQQALIVAGGRVTAARDLELVLNQSSYSRSRAIADRINERFGRADDPKPLAKPLTDQLIKINVPARHRANPGELIELIMHLYLLAGPGFESQQARQLAEVLREQPDQSRSVGMAWRALGRPIVEVLREYYDDPMPELRLTALEAGAWLKDERASHFLSQLADSPDPEVRTRVAKALVMLPRSLKGARTLKKLLDDEQTPVRIAAYESLATISDRLVTDGRVIVADTVSEDVKYVVDAIPAEKPLVYITQVGIPRIAIFNPDLGFEVPMLAKFWNNRLMLSQDDEQDYLKVFYQPPRRGRLEKPSSVTLKAVPDLKTLAYLLGNDPESDSMTDGLGLTYSQVVDVVYQLCRQGHVNAPIEVVVSPLAKQVADLERARQVASRPMTSEPPIGDAGAPADPLVRPDTADRVSPSDPTSR